MMSILSPAICYLSMLWVVSARLSWSDLLARQKLPWMATSRGKRPDEALTRVPTGNRICQGLARGSKRATIACVITYG